MELKCVVCGKMFVAPTKKTKYCCKYCANRSRYPQSRAEWLSKGDADKKLIIGMYDSHLTAKEVAESVGRSVGFVYTAWREAGLKKRPTKKQAKIIELRKQGKCCVEIADELGISKQDLYVAVKAIGMPFSPEEVRRSIKLGAEKAVLHQAGTTEERKDKQRAFFAEKHPDWDLIDGWLFSDGFVEVRHNACGKTMHKSATTARSSTTLICTYCKEEAKKRKEEARQQKQEEKERAFWSQEFKQSEISFSECAYCGAGFVSKNRSIYCSDECRKKGINRSHDKRIRKIVYRDTGINLKKLFSRDDGICWICGERCDYNDHSFDTNGNFIVGPSYPSIDHVHPISKGGSHTWDNIRLAHHYCNTLKNDKVVC